VSKAGLNHACGTAVDNKGDVYASSAGESKIKVFNEAHTELTSIANASEPCGLAVDSKGNLYVSEVKTGHVVKYHPSAYPFVGTPTYEAPVTIDASGSAKGISVDSTDDSLYVAEGTRVTLFKSDGTLLTNNEVQSFSFTGTPTAGAYKLSFEGSETAPLAFNATSPEIQAALEALPTIGSGNVTAAGNSNKVVTFGGTLAAKNVPQLGADGSALVGGGIALETRLDGFNGHLGEGELTKATGVAAYTSHASENFKKRRYISVADVGADQIKVFIGRLSNASGFEPGTLEPRATIDGSETPEGELGLASTGAYLGLDEATGHLYAYDATHKLVNEFEATGQYFGRITNGAFEDAKATQVAVDRSGGANDGTLYVSAGASTGAKLLAFGSVVTPSRTGLPALSHEFTKTCGSVVDSQGDLYVAGGTKIRIYGPAGNELGSFEDKNHPCQLAVDSKGNLYAIEQGSLLTAGDEKVFLYKPSAYPFSGTPSYGAPKAIEEKLFPRGVAVSPANERLFVAHTEGAGVREYASAAAGSGLLKSGFCGLGNTEGIDVYGATGEVYVISESDRAVDVCNPAGTKVLTKIDGSGGPEGAFSGLFFTALAIDQSNGHVLVGEMGSRGAVEEYEASGAFVAQFGSFTKTGEQSDIAIDNSGGANDGNFYVAYDDPANKSDLTAFGPLDYGKAPAEPKEFKLTVTKIGTGTGTVTSTPAGIECGEDCSEAYEEATEVTLTASPAEGSTFTGWSGSGCSGSASCKVTMTEAKSVTAEFTKEETGPIFHKLTVSVTGNGKVSANTGTITALQPAGSPAKASTNREPRSP
jgi:sugar lactone lactonase YvrE